MTTATERLAEWGLGLTLGDVPPTAREAALLHLLDGFGVALLTSGRREGEPALKIAKALGTSGDASVIGSAVRAPAPMAALANGILVHALDYDDTHTGALCHPTSVVLPVAFACGEARNATGADVLAAAIVGYETMLKIGGAVPHAFHARGFHATSVCGVFGAALIAARLNDFDHEQTVNALGIAGSTASGLLEFLDTGSSTKQLHPGWAAHAGIMAAQLASAGATGPASVLEGRYGVFRAFADVEVDPGSITNGLGERWDIEATSIKLYPGCQLSNASLDALASVELIPTDVERIRFDVPRDAVPVVCEPRDAKIRPRSAYEAKFSLPWSAAALLIDGRLGVTTYDDVDRGDVAALADVIDHRVTDPGVAPADADGFVEISLKNGRVIVGRAPGGGRPATRDAVYAKLRTHRLEDPDGLTEAVMRLADSPDLRTLLERTRPALVP